MKPTLLVNVEECQGELRQLAHFYTSQLASGELSEISQVHCRIVKAVSSGRLMGHPAALGILLKCIDMQEKQEKGIENHRMRKMTDVEAGVINEAAVLLACNGASADLMKTLGFSKSMILRTYSRLDTLLEQGLPNPALALLFPEVTEQNVTLIDSATSRAPNFTSRRRFVLCFDSTYLQPLHCACKLHGKRGMVGGPFQMSDIGSLSPGSFQKVDLERGSGMHEKTKANRMLPGQSINLSITIELIVVSAVFGLLTCLFVAGGCWGFVYRMG